MPTVREIEQALFRLAPKEGAMDWDNVGQLLGDPEAEVRRVLVALDITEAVADEAIAENCQLIVRPPSGDELQNGCRCRPSGRTAPQGHLLLKILQERPVRHLYAHEPGCWPPAASNDALAAALGLEDPGPLGDPEGLCRMGNTGKSYAFTGNCKARLPGASRPTASATPGTAARCGRSRWAAGACGNYEDAAIAAGCDVFVTSDLSYHQFLERGREGPSAA